MEKGAYSILSFVVLVVISSLLSRVALGDPRAQLVQLRCGNQPQLNSSIHVANFAASMDTIRSEIQVQGYGTAVRGTGPDTIYGLVQCYGDLTPSDCVQCFAAAYNVVPGCFPANGAMAFLDGCFMRSQTYSYFQEYTGPADRALCGNRTTKNSAFQDTARRAVMQVASNALNNNGSARAVLPVSGTSNETVYVLGDCWKILSAESCRACFENATASILGCLPWSEARALNTGCFMRYSDTNFLNPIPSNNTSSEEGTPTVVIAVVVSSAIFVAMAAVIGAYIWNHKRIQKKRKGFNDAKKLAKILRDSKLNFKYSALEKATGGFDEANKLGQGGFGTVYKGVLSDGREIAVKRLSLNNTHRIADLYNEVNIISCIEHKNLVRLLGCSCLGSESLLVYELLPNRSLDHLIFDSNEGKTLNWEKRFVIIIGTAEGLIYLHENTTQRIIHRDIKASNILLDSKLRAKIADFGLARSFEEDKSHISTAIVGTLGYMAPEYLAHGQLTEKADVYSYGVLLLEIVTGRQNNSSKEAEYSDSLITMAWKHFQQGTVEELIDPNLMLHDYPGAKDEVLRVIHIALLCTQEISMLRPSMSMALQMLEKKDEHLLQPTKPPFIDERTMELNGTSDNSSFPLTSWNSESVASASHSVFYPR